MQSALSDVIRESTVSMRQRGLLLQAEAEGGPGRGRGRSASACFRTFGSGIRGCLRGFRPKHLEALYTELGRLRGIVGGSGAALEGVCAGLERVGRGLNELKTPRTVKKAEKAGVLEKLASANETADLRAQVHALQSDRDEWTRRASGLGPRDLHLLAESLHGLLLVRCKLASRTTSGPLNAARPLLIELPGLAGKLALDSEKADAEDLESLRSVERESARLGAMLTARLESKDVNVNPEASGANTAAMFARRDLVAASVELRSWVMRLRGVVGRRGEEPKRAAYLLARLNEEIEPANRAIRSLQTEFQKETKTGQPNNEALQTASIWIQQQASRASGTDP